MGSQTMETRKKWRAAFGPLRLPHRCHPSKVEHRIACGIGTTCFASHRIVEAAEWTTCTFGPTAFWPSLVLMRLLDDIDADS